jgi:hypothetical protein
MASRTQNRATVAAAGLTANDLLATLQAALRGDDVLPSGEGWKSAAEFAAEWGKSGEQTRRLIRAGMDKGILEKFDGKKGGKAVPFYRPRNP